MSSSYNRADTVGYYHHDNACCQHSEQYHRKSVFQPESKKRGYQRACPCARTRQRYRNKVNSPSISYFSITSILFSARFSSFSAIPARNLFFSSPVEYLAHEQNDKRHRKHISYDANRKHTEIRQSVCNSVRDSSPKLKHRKRRYTEHTQIFH